MPDIFFGMFFLVFFLILGMIVFNFIKGIGQWNKNNHSPRLTVEATVVAKRGDVSQSPPSGCQRNLDTPRPPPPTT